jgi:hypothetical protein
MYGALFGKSTADQANNATLLFLSIRCVHRAALAQLSVDLLGVDMLTDVQWLKIFQNAVAPFPEADPGAYPCPLAACARFCVCMNGIGAQLKKLPKSGAATLGPTYTCTVCVLGSDV